MDTREYTTVAIGYSHWIEPGLVIDQLFLSCYNHVIKQKSSNIIIDTHRRIAQQEQISLFHEHIMQDRALFTASVRYEFRPYDYGAVRNLLDAVRADFGDPGGDRRWQFVTAQTPSTESNAWIIDFLFRDAHDAMIFALKYQK